MPLEVTLEVARGPFRLGVARSLDARSQVTALIGASGAGKTTLLRAIAGLEQHTGAIVRYDGEAWQDAGRFTPPERRPMAFVFHDARLFPHLDVRDNVGFSLRRWRRDGPAPLSATAAIELCGIGEWLDKQPAELSAGQRQRVALARALATPARLLLLDEPLAALDASARASLASDLASVWRAGDQRVIHVTHSLREAALLGAGVWWLRDGRDAWFDSLAEAAASFGADPFGATGALLPATVDAWLPDFALTRVSIDGAPLYLRGAAGPPGATVLVRIAARDVAIAREAPRRTSVLNVLPATIERIDDLDASACLVHLRVGEHRLDAQITRYSARSLELVPAQAVFALVKSVAIDGD